MSVEESLTRVQIFYGDDEYAIAERIAILESQMGDSTTAGLNVVRLDGRLSSETEINSAIRAMPFLADKRLVIITNPLARVNNSSAIERYKNFLTSIPDTTELILILSTTGDKKEKWEDHWLIKWAKQSGGKILPKAFLLPTINEMSIWIIKKAKELGGEVTPAAARLLVDLIGNDTRLAVQEINKLLTYVNYQRPVDDCDVNTLTVSVAEESIFNLVDAIGNCYGKESTRLLHLLMDQQEPVHIFSMIIRQFRLLLIVREAMEGYSTLDKIAQTQHINPYVVKKLQAQAKRFSLSAIEVIYHKLLELEESTKIGKIDLEVGLDVFVAELCK